MRIDWADQAIAVQQVFNSHSQGTRSSANDDCFLARHWHPAQLFYCTLIAIPGTANRLQNRSVELFAGWRCRKVLTRM